MHILHLCKFPQEQTLAIESLGVSMDSSSIFSYLASKTLEFSKAHWELTKERSMHYHSSLQPHRMRHDHFKCPGSSNPKKNKSKPLAFYNIRPHAKRFDSADRDSFGKAGPLEQNSTVGIDGEDGIRSFSWTSHFG